jgi:DNA polymerase V
MLYKEHYVKEVNLDKATGFPSPAQGYEAKNIDLNSILIQNPPATFLMEMDSSDMSKYGILNGTLLIVDRSIKPKNGSIAIIQYEDDFLCREVRIKNRTISFTNGDKDIEGKDIEIFGVVRKAINDYAR